MGTCVQTGCAKQIFGECVFYTGLGIPTYDIIYGDNFNTVVQKITDFVITGSPTTWGTIIGTLSNQTDLQNALNAKFNTPLGGINQYIRGDGTIAIFPTIPAQLNLLAGTNISVTGSYPNLTVNASLGSGFLTNVTNIGSGVGAFAQITGSTIELKSIVAGANISFTPSATEILVDVTGVLTPFDADQNYFKNGGNTFSSPADLGTLDNQPLNFITNGLSRATFSASTGDLSIQNALIVVGNSFLQGTSTIIGVTVDTGETLQVAGNVKVGSAANGTGNFATYSGTGVLQYRMPSEVLTDIGAVDVAGARAAISVLDSPSINFDYNPVTGIITGNVKRSVVTITTNVNPAVGGTVYLADTSFGTISIQIDPTTLFNGVDSGVVTIKKLINNTSPVNVSATLGLIDGLAVFPLQAHNEFISVVSDGTNLYIIQ